MSMAPSEQTLSRPRHVVQQTGLQGMRHLIAIQPVTETIGFAMMVPDLPDLPGRFRLAVAAFYLAVRFR